VPRSAYCERGVEESGDNLNEVGLCVRTMTRSIVQAAVETIVKKKDEEEEVLRPRPPMLIMVVRNGQSLRLNSMAGR